METIEEKIKKQIKYKVICGSKTYNSLKYIYADYHKEKSGGFTDRSSELSIRNIIGFEKDRILMFYPALYFLNQEMYIAFKEEWNVVITNKDLVLCK